MISGRQRRAIVFTVLGICLVAAAVTLNVSWLVINWREGVLIVFGSIFFLVIIAGGVVNTIFLIREIRRNEQHDAFINAVTHELKTPITSIRLYLETLKARPVEEKQRAEFYDVMLADTDRLLNTVEQVLRAGRAAAQRRQPVVSSMVDISELVRECLDLTRVRYKLDDDALHYADSLNGERASVLGDADEIRAAIT